jgi:hypothetical protein
MDEYWVKRVTRNDDRSTRSSVERSLVKLLAEKYAIKAEKVRQVRGGKNQTTPEFKFISDVNIDEEVEEILKTLENYTLKRQKIGSIETVFLSVDPNSDLYSKDEYKAIKSTIYTLLENGFQLGRTAFVFNNTIYKKCGEYASDDTKKISISSRFIEGILKHPLLLFILDTLHDIKRVTFLTTEYKRINKGRDFYADYKNFLKGKYGSFFPRDLIDELFAIKDQRSMEMEVFIGVFRSLRIGTQDLKQLLSENKFQKTRLAFDVWRYKGKDIENTDSFVLNTIYGAYFDSNPSNTQYPEDLVHEMECAKMGFTILDNSFEYNYDTRARKLVVSHSTQSNYNRFKSAYLDTNVPPYKKDVKILYEKGQRISDEYSVYLSKIYSFNRYFAERNEYNYVGKKVGPGIAELCAAALHITANSGIKGEESMEFFENAFALKRAGDYGQIVLAKKLGYIFATNDYIQALTAVLNGVKVFTTCGTAKYIESTLDYMQIPVTCGIYSLKRRSRDAVENNSSDQISRRLKIKKV